MIIGINSLLATEAYKVSAEEEEEEGEEKDEDDDLPNLLYLKEENIRKENFQNKSY